MALNSSQAFAPICNICKVIIIKTITLNHLNNVWCIDSDQDFLVSLSEEKNTPFWFKSPKYQVLQWYVFCVKSVVNVLTSGWLDELKKIGINRIAGDNQCINSPHPQPSKSYRSHKRGVYFLTLSRPQQWFIRS